MNGVFLLISQMSSAYDMYSCAGVSGVIEEYVDCDEIEFFTAKDLAQLTYNRGMTKLLGEIVYFEKPGASINIKKQGKNETWVPSTSNSNYDYMIILRDYQTGQGFILFVPPSMGTTNLAVQRTVWLGAMVVVFDAELNGLYQGLPAFSSKHLILPLTVPRKSIQMGSISVEPNMKHVFKLREKDPGFHVFHGYKLIDVSILPGSYFKPACRRYGCDGNHEGAACPSPTLLQQYGSVVMVGRVMIPSLQMVNGKGEFYSRSTARLFLSEEVYGNGRIPNISMAKMHCAIQKSLKYYEDQLCTWDVAGWSNSEGELATEIDAGNVKQHITVLQLRYDGFELGVNDSEATLEQIIKNNPHRIKDVVAEVSLAPACRPVRSSVGDSYGSSNSSRKRNKSPSVVQLRSAGSSTRAGTSGNRRGYRTPSYSPGHSPLHGSQGGGMSPSQPSTSMGNRGISSSPLGDGVKKSRSNVPRVSKDVPSLSSLISAGSSGSNSRCSLSFNPMSMSTPAASYQSMTSNIMVNPDITTLNPSGNHSSLSSVTKSLIGMEDLRNVGRSIQKMRDGKIFTG
jgi:hypothetical protein